MANEPGKVIDRGGPAFARPACATEEDLVCSAQQGMSVRMWLAGQALSGIYAGWPPDAADYDHPVAARNALEAADALIAESNAGVPE